MKDTPLTPAERLACALIALVLLVLVAGLAHSMTQVITR